MNVEQFGKLKTIRKFDKLFMKETFTNVTEVGSFVYEILIEKHQKAEFIAVQSLFVGAEAATINKSRGIGGSMKIYYGKSAGRLRVVVYSDKPNTAALADIKLFAAEKEAA